jgi:hypothetical protein
VSFEGGRVGQGGLVGEKLQTPHLVRVCQPFRKQAPEEAREHPDGEEEAESAGNSMLAVERQAAAPDYEMGVRMMSERRSQACSAAVSPMRTPRCLGSPAMVIRVSAAVGRPEQRVIDDP